MITCKLKRISFNIIYLIQNFYFPISNTFRQGLVTGDKVVVHPIMKWCLEKLAELKKRAYLARFLVKVEISPEFLADPAVADLNNQYENLMAQFKETHKNYDHLTSTQHTTADLKKEIEQMVEEKEQLIKRLERVKKRVIRNADLKKKGRNLFKKY